MNLFSLVQIMMFLCAISFDTFLMGITYGMAKIKIPFSSILTINLVSIMVLFCSFVIGQFFFNEVSTQISKWIAFFFLFSLGCFKLFDFFIKRYLKKIEFHFLNFIIQIYVDPKKADKDFSKSLSLKESIYLSFTLSIDSFLSGIGVGIFYSNYEIILISSFLFGMIAVYLGRIVGEFLSKRFCYDFNWVCGVILILLAFLKI